MSSVVSVVIVSHDHKQYVETCLSSVFAQQGVSFDVVLVENASRDGTSSYVKRNFPSVKIIKRTRRYGFSANVNCGIRASSGGHILILNPDTQLHKGSLLTLVKRMQSSNTIGICGPRLINPDRSTQMSYRNFPTWKTALFRRTPLRLFFPNNIVIKQHLNVGKNHDKAQKVDWMLGACLLFRRSMLDKIGLLDEKYRLYVEDVDICLRAHNAGWGVWYEPRAIVEHKHEAKSDRSFFSVHSYYHAMSMIRYVTKHWVGFVAQKMNISPLLQSVYDEAQDEVFPSAVSIAEGQFLLNLVQQFKPNTLIEAGLGDGLSTLWFEEGPIRPRKHIIVEQHTATIGRFKKNIIAGKRLHIGPLVAQSSQEYFAAQLKKKRSKIDMIFLDADNRFDGMMVDLYFTTKLLRLRGIVASRNLWNPSVRKALWFFYKNLPYTLPCLTKVENYILKKIFFGYFIFRLICKYKMHNYCVLQKENDDDRPWNHFATF